ncbi:MAG TPA: relaxase/mobilization nuclease domain-containing protein [Flavipsychrobacter sp.]|nr:relaxase/mobilization nuclease domain-containing protein [Flavipsychrobacter sp.]
MKEEKTTVKDRVEEEKQRYEAAGFSLSYNDVQHLLNERSDYLLWKDFKEKFPEGNYQGYIQNYLMDKNYQVPGWSTKNEKEIKPFLIKHNVKANDINGFIKEFEENQAGRIHKRADQVALHHTILSWSGLDRKHVTDDMLTAVAGEYIKLRGENNKYVVNKHIDKEHIHLHIIMSGTQLNGLASRVSKQEFQQIKVQLQDYQRLHYQNLTNSLPEHGKAERQRQRGEYEKLKRDERRSILNSLLSCIEVIEPKSSEHLFGELEAKGFSTYTRSGVVTGFECDGYKFRFSRLPIDLEKLKALDAKNARIENDLSELQAIRGTSDRVQALDRLECIETSQSENEADFDREIADDEPSRTGPEDEDDKSNNESTEENDDTDNNNENDEP